jgi:hypothetical protein
VGEHAGAVWDGAGKANAQVHCAVVRSEIGGGRVDLAAAGDRAGVQRGVALAVALQMLSLLKGARAAITAEACMHGRAVSHKQRPVCKGCVAGLA